MRFVIATPTGLVGRTAMEWLFRKGYAPVIIHRDPDRVEPLVRRGARLVRGSLEDPAVIAAACRGADGLLWVTPSSVAAANIVSQCQVFARALDEALRRTGPIRVVNISACGARHSSGVGPVKGLHAVEQVLNRAAPDVTHLRAGYYFENFIDHLPMLVKGRHSLPVSGSVHVPMVATRDVAAVAVHLLLDRGWKGNRALGVDGPEVLTFAEASASISRGIGRRLSFETVLSSAAAATLRALGFPADSIHDIREFYAALTTGKFRFEESRILTAPHPTTLETFAREILKPLLKL